MDATKRPSPTERDRLHSEMLAYFGRRPPKGDPSKLTTGSARTVVAVAPIGVVMSEKPS